MGFVGFFRKWIKDFAAIALPITEMTKDGVPFVWGEAQQQAFDALKRAVTSAPVLKIFDPVKPCLIRPDASKVAVGGALFQTYEELHPVAFISYKLNETQRKWPMYETEFYAMIKCLQVWKYYLAGNPDIHVESDLTASRPVAQVTT